MNIHRPSISEVLHEIEDRLERWREEDRTRKAEAEANRNRLWAEAAEREKLLEEAISREEGERKSLKEAARERGAVFVVHSPERAGRFWRSSPPKGRAWSNWFRVAEDAAGAQAVRGSCSTALAENISP